MQYFKTEHYPQYVVMSLGIHTTTSGADSPSQDLINNWQLFFVPDSNVGPSGENQVCFSN